MRYLLNLIYLAVLVLLLVCGLHPRYRHRDVLTGFWARFWGLAPKLSDARPVVWIHAACVGETLLGGTVIRRLQERRSDVQFVLSVFSVDGLAVARKEFPDLVSFYSPYDFTWSVNSVLQRLNPIALVIVENDLWPNLIGAAGRRGIPCAAFNSRISPREEREHAWNGWLMAPALSSIRWWGVVDQQAADGIRRFFGVGSPPVEVTGMVKWDSGSRSKISPGIERLRKQIAWCETDRILVAGSTHPGEEEILLSLFVNVRQRFPTLRLILAPRDILRCNEIDGLARLHSLPSVRLSGMADSSSGGAPFILVDTLGDLRDLWRLAEMAFVGGSLVPHGGHNMVEPVGYGIPTCFGPHLFNFQTLADDLVTHGGASMVHSADELEACLADWLENPQEAARVGEIGRSLLARHVQPLETTVQRILTLIPNSSTE